MLRFNCVRLIRVRPGSPEGEIHEFKEELRSLDRGERKEGVKKVIAAMTVGKVRFCPH